MRHSDEISENQLNSFVDNQLENGERSQVLSAIRKDKSLADELSDLQQINELISLAYEEVPPSPRIPAIDSRRGIFSPLRIAAMLALIILGGSAGWYVQNMTAHESNLPFETLAQLDTHKIKDEHILIHINAMDDKRIRQVLNRTDELLKYAKKHNKKVQIEVVANASGLGMLRKGSPYTRRIEQLVAQNRNVSFLACGFAMENAKLKEGKDIQLLPQAKKVDAALEEILRRLKQGWLYVRG